MNTPNNLEWLTELLSNVASLEGEYPSNITIEEAKQTIATKLAEARVDPKLSAAELALEYLQEHKDSKQSGELSGVTNFIGWLSEKARIATLTNDKERE